MEIDEVDRGRWFSFENARKYVRAEQVPLLGFLREWKPKEAQLTGQLQQQRLGQQR
jgi:predicted NUDIX family NTP pyrophosphohydrolase